MNDRPRRLFVGVELDDDVRAACANARQRLERTAFAARYEPSEKLHLTVAFLGNVAGGRCDAAIAAMRAAAADCSPFDLRFDKIGAFPNERRPRIVYVGAREAGDGYRTLAAEVRAAYRELGFSFEDDAVAHVTIARVTRGSRPLPPIEPAPALLRVERLSLFDSVHDPQTRTTSYSIAATADLRG
jgi:2'-5' RNA ligase